VLRILQKAASEFNAGFNKKLLLKHEAVPTLKPEAAVVGPKPFSKT